jgi:taurine dioxygenase
VRTSLEIRKLAGAIGAEIGGVDLSGGLGEDVVAAIRKAFLDHVVVFFRDQDMTQSAFLALARRFGRPVEYPFVKGLEGYPEIIAVAKLEDERVNFGGIWHTDTAYLAIPPMGTMLLAREVPAAGGDTIFANMVVAYETLSDGLRRLLEPMTAINSSAKTDVSRTREDRIRSSPSEQAAEAFTAEHPVVRTHPETGRKALYVNPAHTVRFGGMTEAESAPLLEVLYRHQTRPEFTCRFRWETGSLAFWDNRAAQHNPVNDYHGFRRVMHRITLGGEKPV